MPINPDEGLFEYAQFSGLRNTVPVDQIGLDDLDVASNIDINDAKRATLRKGHAAAMFAGNFTSLWANASQMLAVSGPTLVRLLPDYAVLCTGLIPGLDMSYTPVAGRVFYSNSVDKGIIQDGRSRTWGLDVPSAHPIASDIGGVLPAGRYQFAVTYLRSDRQESGSLAAGSIDLASAGGVRLDAIPVSTDADVEAKVLYFTKCNGDTLYRVGIITPSTTWFNYMVQSSGTVRLITQHLRPAPAGQIVENFNGGRMLVAQGNVLYYSEPYSLELFDLRKKYTFESRITLVSALDNGCFLGTENEVVWLDGSVPEKWNFAPKLAYGAIIGASTQCSRDMILDGQGTKQVAVFGTHYGLCVGFDGGEIINLTQDRWLWPIQPKGCAIVRRHRGFVQALVSFQGSENSVIETVGNASFTLPMKQLNS